MDERTRSMFRLFVGVLLALVLTAIPFGMVASGAVTGDTGRAVIAGAAALQIVVHLRFFLQLGSRSTPHETLLAIGFAVVLVALMLGGSLWIMTDLHHRMMP